MGRRSHFLDPLTVEEASDDSDPEMYRAIRKEVQTGDWVGEIVANLEVWEKGPSGPRLRGTRIVSPRFSTTLRPRGFLTDSCSLSYLSYSRLTWQTRWFTSVI